MVYLRDPETKKARPDVLERRRAWFEALNTEAQNHDAWIISTPGNREVIVECLLGSAWPDVLAKRGYRLEETEDGERIIPTAIREAMGINADGTLGPLTPGSTQATTMTVHHPGIVKTKRFSFASAGQKRPDPYTPPASSTMFWSMAAIRSSVSLMLSAARSPKVWKLASAALA
jgi:hypothetical protein